MIPRNVLSATSARRLAYAVSCGRMECKVDVAQFAPILNAFGGRRDQTWFELPRFGVPSQTFSKGVCATGKEVQGWLK